MKPTLVIMAAGMGSRYGGLKQIEPIGPNGEIIMDYSIYDAIQAGFGKIVIIIKEENEKVFRETIGNKIEEHAQVVYVYQKLSLLPEGYEVPKDRIKPWGTAHAILCCKDVVDTPFAVINADDFYGSSSFQKIHDYLLESKDTDTCYQYSMIGYQLEKTLTKNGHVARGICQRDENGLLLSVVERTKIQQIDDKIQYTEDDKTWVTLPKDSTVSMNVWGFTPSIFGEIEQKFKEFLDEHKEDNLKAEFYIPSVVDALILENKAKVKVLDTDEQWYGVTYIQDKTLVKEAIAKMVDESLLAKSLW
jgi:NDP-sugar pyrophosphorylase family protein